MKCGKRSPSLMLNGCAILIPQRDYLCSPYTPSIDNRFNRPPKAAGHLTPERPRCARKYARNFCIQPASHESSGSHAHRHTRSRTCGQPHTDTESCKVLKDAGTHTHVHAHPKRTLYTHTHSILAM